MARSPLSSARAALSSEQKTIEREIAALEARLEQVRDLMRRFDDLGEEPRRKASDARAGSRGRGAGRATLAGTVRAVLRGSRKPLHIDEILDRVAQLGVPSTARNPRASLQTTLFTMASRGEVRNVGGNQWERTAEMAPATDSASA